VPFSFYYFSASRAAPGLLYVNPQNGENMENVQTIIPWLKIITVLGALSIIGYGLNRVFERLKAKDQGFGPNSLKAIGVILFVPTLLILAVVTDFKTETLAALLGTVAGYVLSNSKETDE
jgi:hypothetical protein